MAEQAASAVASAVIGGVTDRALTTVMRKLRPGSRSGPAAAHEKLQRLETLVLKVRCAVEVSEKHAIGSTSLLEWRDRLREAATEGGAVVLDFQRRAKEDGGDAAATSASAPGQQQPAGGGGGAGAAAMSVSAPDQQQPAGGGGGAGAAAMSVSAPGQQQPAGGGGGAGAASGALYFTRSALGSMAQRVRDATRRLFSTDEDTQKLDSALEKMERLSPDITQFLMALQVDVSPELGQGPAKKMRLSIPVEPMDRLGGACFLAPWPKHDVLPEGGEPRARRGSGFGGGRKRMVAESAIVQLASAADEARENREREARMLAKVLRPKLRRTEIYYLKKTDDRDMEGLEWLAEWAAVLREAVERRNAVLQTLCPGSDVIHKTGGGALEADGELYSFARAVERLAQEEQCFTVLVDLCPRKQQ